VAMVVFIAVTGLLFLVQVNHSIGMTDPLTLLMYESIMVVLTLLVTVLCMRLFAEERRSGTLETLMTAPVTEVQVVLGKYAGAMTFLVLTVAPAAAQIFVLDAMCPGIKGVDLGGFFGGSLLILLISGYWVALGMVFSLMTRSQVSAAIAIFCILWVTIMIGEDSSPVVGWLTYLGLEWPSITEHMDAFCRGSVETRPIVAYSTWTAFLLFVSTKMLESRRWH